MQKNYLIAGGVTILLLGVLTVFALKETPDGNTTETKLTPVPSFSHSHGIAVDVVDSKKVFIATHEGLYLLSDDKDLYQVGKMRDDLMGFSPHPTEAETFFSSGHGARGGNIGFQKTTDGGMTWTQVSGGLAGPVDFHAMTVSQVNSSVAYGFFGGKLQRTTDGGRQWEYTKGTVAPFSLSTDPKDEKVIYASTQDGVQVSKDMGDTWQSISPDLEGGAVTVFAIDPLSTYALAFSEKLGGMGKSVDGGSTWQKVGETFGGEVVLYLAFSKSQSGTLYTLTSKNSVYKSITSGDSWVKVR